MKLVNEFIGLMPLFKSTLTAYRQSAGMLSLILIGKDLQYTHR
jgi:hypothetical protein